MLSLGVILPAAGRSTRFAAHRNKLLERLGDRPVIAHTVEAFARRADVAAIVVATGEPQAITEALRSMSPQHALDSRIAFCPGGTTRAHSVWNALQALQEAIEWVAVHDAARPLVSQGLIDRAVEAARCHGAAVPALPIHLTIKEAAAPLPARVERTIPRQKLWAMQTPQIMRRSALHRAFTGCPIPLEEVTDDAQLLELAGEEVWLVAGEEANLKITTETDLRVAELMLQMR